MEAELVGRGVELERLRAFVDALEDGVPGVALVSGEAGIGKSRLVDELTRGMRGQACAVLAGRCVDLGTSGPPYATVASALRQAPGPMTDEALDALTGVVEVPRARLFDLVRAVLTGLGRRRPTVLVIEDLHWVDQATRDMLVFLLAAAREGRWGLVVTFRGQQLQVRPRLRDLAEHLGRERHVERVALVELTRDEVAQLASGLAGEALSHVEVAELHRRSGGIPLLVEELVAARDHADPSEIPPQLRTLFLARLRPLSATATLILRLAALVGPDIDEHLLARASGTPPEVIEGALDDAVRAGAVVVGHDGYEFRHELLRELVCEDMSPARRVEFHRVLAEAMAVDAGADQAALAHHWYEARAHAPAAEAALRAADAAQRVHAHAAVHGHLERVLGLWDHLTDEARDRVGGHGGVLARAAEAAYLAGALPRAVALGLDRAAEATSPVARIAGLERLSRYQWVAGEGRAAEATSEQALAALTDDVPADLQAQVLSGHAWLLAAAGHATRARPFTEAARAAAERSGDLRQRCRAMLAWAWAHCESTAARTTLADARVIAEETDADEELGRAAVVAFAVAAAAGSARDRVRVAHDGRRLARERGMAGSYEVTFAAWEAGARIDLGEWSKAARLMEEAIPGASSGMPAQFVAAEQARLAAAQGNTDLVDQCLTAVQATSSRVPQQPWVRITALLAAAESRAWEGDLVAACGLVGRAVSLQHEAFVEFVWVCAAVRARVVADAHRPGTEVETPAAVALPDPATPPVDPRDRAWERTWRAEQARAAAPRDTQSWREAMAAWQAAGDPYRVAYASWRLAQALLQDRSGRGEARDLLDHAARGAAALQARPLEAAVARTAATARFDVGDGETPVPPSESAARAAGLTPREMEVLALVATGLTNRDVAEHLVISPRTVGTHVSRLLRKLGAARRTEAVDVARRRGLLEP